MHRVRRLKVILWLVTGLAAAVACGRFLFGLGATTNLSDAIPWGVWIGFDVMSGVALAAGGFVVAGAVYIFRLEKFRSFVRPAVLTAFLGYVAVAVGLLFDLGLPWNIWHMLIYWNPRSPLFEVGWCVMLYLTVLALEFFPVPAEEFSQLAKVRRFLLRIRLPLVIAGIGLSTLHQSSLGSLFLLMPSYLHPLWYSPILPVLFLVSAIGLGLTMVMFESHATAYFYYRRPETRLLAGFGKASRWVLLGYVALRFADLAVRGQLRSAATAQWQVWWFWTEMAVMAFVPIVLLSIPKVRDNRTGQWTAAGFGVAGVVLNRLNVGGLVHQNRGDMFYLPSWTELTISAGVVSLAVLLFLYIVERFRVWEERPADPEADPTRLPEFDLIGMTWLGVPIVAARTVYSLAFIIAASVGIALIAPERAASSGVEPAPVHHARGGETLWIDGNLDGYGVPFKHEVHKSVRVGQCAVCHHMNLPLDQQTGCHQCHSDMYLPSDAFKHEWHASERGAELACAECHRQGEVRTAESAKDCSECHADLIPPAAAIAVKQYNAIGYVSAMHQMCIGCHAGRTQQAGNPRLAQCATCHGRAQEYLVAEKLAPLRRGRIGKRVVLPPY